MIISTTLVAKAVAILGVISSAQANTLTVNVGGLVNSPALSFVPNTINISPGDTLSFVFNGQHTASHASPTNPCADASPSDFDFSGNPGQMFNHTFPTAGTFHFFCKLPGHCQAGMTGVILVGQSAAANGSSTSPSAATPTANAGSANGGLYGSSGSSTLSGMTKAALLTAAVMVVTVTF
jgi:plastocyanin